MSINDLIHTNAHNAFEQGIKTEQERIIKLLEENDFYISGHCHQGPDCCYPGEKLIAIIKGVDNANN